MYYGSCKDILDCVNNLNLSEEDSKYFSNVISMKTVDRADEQRRLCFNEQSLQPITKAVLSGLEYLHSKHIIHRCICPENIFISQTGF
jgi:serine/threonine protein kinase